MKLIRSTILITGAAFALSGCAALSVATKASDFVNTQEEVDAMPDTAVSDMPTSGSATYSGSGYIAADYGADSNVMFLGDSEMTATFTATGGSVVGRMDNFSGLELTDAQRTQLENGDVDASVLLAAAKSASGEIGFTNGTIAGSGFVTDADGTVSMEGSDYGVSGNVQGQFHGDQAASMKVTGDTGTTGLRMTKDGVAATSGTTLEINAVQ